MLNNPKQRKYLREIKKQENVKAHDRHSILTKLLPDKDAQFPPLLKLASKQQDLQPLSHVMKNQSPVLGRKNSIYHLKDTDEVGRLQVKKIMNEHKSPITSRKQVSQELFRQRVACMLGSRKTLIYPTKVGLPYERTRITLVVGRRYSDVVDYEMRQAFLDQKELTVHKKFIETSINSISYERDRLRQSIKRQKQLLLSMKKNKCQEQRPHRQRRNRNTLGFSMPETLSMEIESPSDSPRPRKYNLSSYEQPVYDETKVQLRPWTNNLQEQV